MKSNNVVNLVERIAADPVFFHKSQVQIGTKLINIGRRNIFPMEWEVTKIYTFSIVRGQYRSRNTDKVVKLSDAIELRPINPPKGWKRKYMELSFQYLSYSSIWRIV
jgi:hypothetical protein